VETAGDVILLLSPGGEILELNREAERVLGVVREQALGKRFLETFVPESHHEICRSDAAKALGGVPTRGFVYPILRGHARVRFLSWNLDRMLDSSGGSIGLIACGHDVTDQKVLEESILSIARGVSAATGQKFFRHLVSRLAEILEADFVLIGELERDGAEPARIRTIARFADGKPAKNIVYDLAGSPCENVVGKRLCSYASGVQELFPRDRVLVATGVVGYVGAPLYDSQDRALGIINVLYRREIPNVRLAESVLRIFATRAAGELERKTAEQELLASERLNQRIIESMPGGVVQVDADGGIPFANEQAQRFLGLEYDDATERYVESFPERTMIAEDGSVYPRAEDPLVKCLASGIEQPPRVIGAKRGDAVAWGIFTAIPLAGPGGKVDEAVVMFVDISDRKRAEEERRRLEAQVQHAQKLESLGILAGGIAHDFNNLLTGILGNVSLALMKLPADSDLAVSLGRVERAAERAAKLTNQMLAYAGKGSFLIGSFALDSLIQEIVPLVQSSVSKKAKLELDLDSKLPEIEGDRTQIEQVVMNLITNASDALEGNEGVIRLVTGLAREAPGLDLDAGEGPGHSSWVFLEVSDNGAGMDEETRLRIFDPFFTTKFTGRGLGLAAVQGIVRGHRGTIRVESTPGRGTKFTVFFPAGRSPSPERSRPVASERARGSGTVLVIDDEESVRDVATAALRSAGYEVVAARDGFEGVARFRERTADIVCVVVDVSMPRMDGEQTVQQIRALASTVPVLLTSGYTERDARERFARSDVEAFIQKPFRAAELIDKIAGLFRS
jgi:PAS domain S-box-containing protein